jgi:hypothetical protein
MCALCLCRAMFSSCSSCGFAACEGCVLQLQLQCGSSSMSDAAFCDGLVGPSGKLSCWCAPPLRTAGTVRCACCVCVCVCVLHVNGGAAPAAPPLADP